MDEVNKPLYIPLYGKAQVSKKGLILHDGKAEKIWESQGFSLKGKAKSKWLAYFMSMRAKVFDQWVLQQMQAHPSAAVLHIGCGLDSRILRVGNHARCWYDVDFPEVISLRKKYYQQTERYHMLGADASQTEWLSPLPDCQEAIVVLEGISMYLKNEAVAELFRALQRKFPRVWILMDVYTTFGARASKYKNPVNEVGVTQVYGIDDPRQILEGTGIAFAKEYSMTPPNLVSQLSGFEKWFFTTMFTGRAASKIYRLFAFVSAKKT